MNGDLILPEILEENLPIKISFKTRTKSTQLDAKEAIDLGNEVNTLYLLPIKQQAEVDFNVPSTHHKVVFI